MDRSSVRLNWHEPERDASPSLELLQRHVAGLFEAVSDAFENAQHSTSGTSEETPARPTGVRRCQSKLSSWQIDRITRHIETHLDSTITVRHLARLVRLSEFHFFRVFRASFGVAPHAYVIRKRMDLAQKLLLTTDVPLVTVAADCGMADQSHFNRVFRRLVGESPGEWRRARMSRDAVGALRTCARGQQPRGIGPAA